VFIVHGHDEIAKLDVSNFVTSLGLEPIILHMQASSGMTIIEKIEHYSNVGFGIVLYTPCDVGQKVGDLTGRHRARQNVVFEHGYLIGKLGRPRVSALVKGAVETPNDISGVVYVAMDSAGLWQKQLKVEMRGAGYHV
jgi:predicted nucleotide-binding protein